MRWKLGYGATRAPALACAERPGALGQIVLWLSLLAWVLSATAARSQDTYSDKSLEDLLKIRIVTATQTYQTSAEAPAVVTVLTGAQIRDLGVSTLYEALEFVPGVVVTESYWGYTMVNLRGNLQTHYNNKVLLLINGHAMREVINGSFHLEMVPLDAVERIEVIRGPGSALYGTNAFAGVINIVTHTGASNDNRRLQAGAGSFSTFEGSATYGRKSGAWDMFGAASLRNDDGYPYRVAKDEQGKSGEFPFENDVTNALVRVSRGDLTISGGYFHQNKRKLGITPVLAYGGIQRFDAGFADVQWERPLGSKLRVGARLRLDLMDRSSDVNSFPFDGFLGHANADVQLTSSGNLFGVEAQLRYEPSERVSLLSGVVYERLHTDPYLFTFVDNGSPHPFTAYTTDIDEDDISWFGQVLFKATSRDQVVLGLRANHNENAGNNLAPRLGWVHRFGESTYAKLLYGQAYRSPDFFETNVETYNVLYGDPNLKSESIRTLDLVLDSRLGESVHVQLNAFALTSDDIIMRVPTSDPVKEGKAAVDYRNAGAEEIRGVEAALNARLTRRGRAFATYTYTDGKDRNTDKNLDYVAQHTATVGLSWRLASWLSVKPNLLHISSRLGVPAQTRLNFVAHMPLGRGLALWLIGRNLTDEEILGPEYIRRKIPSVPSGAERSFLVRASWNF